MWKRVDVNTPFYLSFLSPLIPLLHCWRCFESCTVFFSGKRFRCKSWLAESEVFFCGAFQERKRRGGKRAPYRLPVAVVVFSMRVCFAAGLLAHSVVAQFGTIRIDWVSEGALGDGRATPHVGGLSAVLEGEEPAPPPAPSADTYEEAWWQDDFAHDPPAVWFGAATTQRGKRPASMVSTMSKTRPITAGQRGLTG